MSKLFLIRLDVGDTIGAGHFMRCRSIAEALESLGHKLAFVVSNDASLRIVQSADFKAYKLEGSPLRLTKDDGLKLAELAASLDASGVLVDSYGVSTAFFDALKGRDNNIAYIDDLYSYELSLLEVPDKHNVDIVINYGFACDRSLYEQRYAESDVRLLMGPSFAPLRPGFSQGCYEPVSPVHRILLTSGSTNPKSVLERMIYACELLEEDIEVGVVVGAACRIKEDLLNEDSLTFYEGISDLAPLMKQADLVVSAGGSTLYELACVGVPTIALPIVENQIGNVGGFLEKDLGLGCRRMDWTPEDVKILLDSMVRDYSLRKAFSAKMKKCVDGRGALRVATALVTNFA